MLTINDTIEIDEDELDVKFVRSGGPGGQHVNKVATAVQLRFDVAASNLPDEVKSRLETIAGNRLSDDGMLSIEASRFRSQKRNREDAIERFVELVRQAATPPKKRRPTKPSARAKAQRLDEKKRRAGVKESRRKIETED